MTATEFIAPDICNNECRTVPVEACCLCGSEGIVVRSGLRDRLADAPGLWRHRQCTSPGCRLVWLDPMPSEGDLAVLYRGYGINHSGIIYGGGSRSRRFWNAVAESVEVSRMGGVPQPHEREGRLERLARSCGKLIPGNMLARRLFGERVHWADRSGGGSKLLDVGCGSGGLMERLLSQGWEVTGVEPDPAAAELGRKKGLKILNGTVETALSEEHQFDAVTMQHVIEHLPDPVRTLKTLGRHLPQKGRVYVTTPNTESLCARGLGDEWLNWDAPRHLYLFNRASIRRTFELAGFRVLELWTAARMASWLWTFSQTTRPAHGGTAPTRQPGMMSWMTGRAIQRAEQVAGWFWDIGEELVVVAERA